jgi:site-specific DNA-cytosine methylase
MQQPIEQKILSRIYGNGRGWAFSPADFADLGARPTIDSALHRREREGIIRRVIRGIYDYPRQSKALGGPVSPNIDQVADALARKFVWRIQPNGATAQNLLGLSTQVPARLVYLSDGPDRSYTVGKTSLAFEHTALKEAGFKLQESRLVVQALMLLQGFPPTYELYGTLSDQIRLVSDAVPPPLGEAIARSLIETLGYDNGTNTASKRA